VSQDQVVAVTDVASVPLVPELRLRLLMPTHPLWHATPEEAEAQGLRMPYWAFAWPGGQGLARWVLDHPDLVAGRHVLDIGSGGAIEGLAAARAGARAVHCWDIDPLAAAAARLNAELNGVQAVEAIVDDPLAHAPHALTGEVVLVGDLTFDEAIVTRLVPWLRAHVELGRTVLVGDAGRVGLPPDFIAVGRHAAPFDGNPNGSTDWFVTIRRLGPPPEHV
jgi:predicted nicotinamide N-methyase